MAAAFLFGWKEISAFLNQSVRTSQRREQESGMPVHRFSSRSNGGVLAIPQELEDWAEATSKRPATSFSELHARIAYLEEENRSLREKLIAAERIEVPQEFAALDAGIKVRIAESKKLVRQSALTYESTTDMLRGCRPNLYFETSAGAGSRGTLLVDPKFPSDGAECF